MTTATNPESGTTTYDYDGAGNVTHKVDARGANVWYCYDNLNRLSSKSYSQACPVAGGDQVEYLYDSSTVSGSQNTIGRLTSEIVISGGNLLARRLPYVYDAMGRVKAEQCIPGTCSGAVYVVNYNYDAAGSMNSSTNGLSNPQVQLSYGYDPGGHRIR